MYEVTPKVANLNSHNDAKPQKAIPFLRWAGSKRQLINSLSPYWFKKDHARYIEPFLGAGHLFFSINPAESILSDINSDLILTYNIIKSHPNELYGILSEMPITSEFYYAVRSKSIKDLNHLEKAARFIYLNRYCFNGLYRTDMKGNFNVPYGPNKSGRLPTVQALSGLSDYLKKSKLVCSDFQNVIYSQTKKNDFLYLDPPYISKKRIFTSYNGKEFTLKDYDRLFSCLEYIDSCGASFLMSGLHENDILNKFKKWNIELVITSRKISGLISSRNSVQEVLISNI